MKKNIGWDETVRYIFYGVAAFMFNRATGILDKLQNDVSDLKSNVSTVAVKYEYKFENFEFKLNSHSERITNLEKEANQKRKHN